MHLLLGLETPDRRNLWHAAKDSAGDIDGYIFDISHASVICADAIFGDQRQKLGQSTGLLCRYALILSSINSLAKTVPPRLLLALVKEGFWSPAKGLSYIDLGSYRDLERAYALANLIPLLSSSSLLEKAKKVALALPYPWKMEPVLLEELLNEILDQIVVSNDYNRGNALKLIISRLSTSEEQLIHILSKIDWIEPAEDRIELLLMLKPYMSMNLLFNSIVRILRQANWCEGASFYADSWDSDSESWKELVAGIDKQRYLEQLLQLLHDVPTSAREPMLAEIRILEFDLGVLKHYQFSEEVLKPIKQRFLEVITECRQFGRADVIEKLTDCYMSFVALGGIQGLLEFQHEIRRVSRWWP